jgi:CheY-like chemotaxis protein
MMSSFGRILLVEDNPIDRFLVIRALQRAGVATVTDCVEDGAEALCYLRRQGKYQASLRPHLVLLDLNLPRLDGRAVLLELKRDRELQSIPVVVLTTSRAAEDVACSYRHHCNSYVRKPGDFPTFAGALATLTRYWFGVVSQPPG